MAIGADEKGQLCARCGHDHPDNLPAQYCPPEPQQTPMETATEAAHDALNAVLNSLRSPDAKFACQQAWNELEAAIQRHADEMKLIRECNR